MNKRHVLITTLTLLLLLTAIAYASFATSFTYTKFNSSTYTYEETDKTRTAWQVKIVNQLTYDTSTSGTASIRLCDATSGNYNRIDLAYTKGGPLDVWVGDQSTADKIVSTTWTSGEPIYYTLDSNGYLDIGNETDLDAILSDYPLGEFSLAYVAAAGQNVNFTEGEQVATAGYVSIEITDPPISLGLETALDVIFVTIPLIFTVAVLGVIIKMFKEVGKS